jgi:parallel beta-helix repeat protein
MNGRTVLFLAFILICGLLIIPLHRSATATLLQYDDFTIMPNGSIFSPYSVSPPVTTSDNVTYTLTRNVTLLQYIQVERNNTVLDGAGYTLTNQQPTMSLWLERVSNVTVKNLNFLNSGQLSLESASDCVLIDNNFTDCESSFVLQSSSNNTLSDNTMKNASFGYVYGGSISDYLNSIDTSNTVDGKPVYYLTNQKDLAINPALFPEIGFLALVNSTDTTVQGLSLAHCSSALLFAFTNNSKIINNTLDDSYFGIYAVSSCSNLVSGNEFIGDEIPLEFVLSCSNNTIIENIVLGTLGGIGLVIQSDNNTVSYNNVSGSETGIFLSLFSSYNVFVGNKIENCSEEGIKLIQSQNNTFVKNTIMNTSGALHLEQAETCNNTFYDNNFENNTRQFLIGGTIGRNIWDNGVEGNYWSDYNGTGGSQNGIGGAPYVIDANNTDHFPLMGAFQSFNVQGFYGKFAEVDIISNSTIENALFLTSLEDQPLIWSLTLIVHGQNETDGFCRITFSNDLLNSSSYPVYVFYSQEWHAILSRIIESNGTQTTLYFAYGFPSPISDYNIGILPEFSFLLIPLLFMIATLLTAVVCRKMHMT